MKIPLHSAKLITAREQAALLAVSTRHLHDLTKERLVPCVRLGRSVRYSPEAVIEALAAKGGSK
jgi:excisionase family DNA binding protein